MFRGFWLRGRRRDSLVFRCGGLVVVMCDFGIYIKHWVKSYMHGYLMNKTGNGHGIITSRTTAIIK